MDAGEANATVPDDEVLACAAAERQILIIPTNAATFSAFIDTGPCGYRRVRIRPDFLQISLRTKTLRNLLEQKIGQRSTDRRPTPMGQPPASEESAYPASVVGRRNGCIRG